MSGQCKTDDPRREWKAPDTCCGGGTPSSAKMHEPQCAPQGKGPADEGRCPPGRQGSVDPNRMASCCGDQKQLTDYDKETFECMWYYFNKERHKDDEAYSTLKGRMDGRPRCLGKFPIDCCYLGDTLTVRAAESGMWKVLDYCLRCLGANPNKTGRRGMTPLYLVRRYCDNNRTRQRMDALVECYGGVDRYFGCRDQFPCNYNNHYWNTCYPPKCGFDPNDYSY